ncbi:MAG: hypothetical protein M3463_18540, partial [Verrucomicrobiota bacterium]|nr:hypothetical protein [Verrucomicrobiota bacterium]
MSSLRRAFLSSPHHAAMALATLGAGLATAEPLYFILGTTAYVLGWVYVPDLPIFRRWLEKKQGAAETAAAQVELADFASRRESLINSLGSSRRERYRELAAVCEQIEAAATEGAEDLRVRKLEELMWTYLRLLSME